MRSTLSLFVGLVALLLPVSSARAEAPRHAFRLVYVREKGAESCPKDGSLLRTDLAGIMEYDPVRSDARIEVTATFERDGAELTAVAVMRDEAGGELGSTKRISTKSPCRELVGGLALAIDAWFGLPKEPAPPPKAAEPPPCPSCPSCPLPPPAPLSPASPTAPTLRNLEGYGGIDVLGSFGVTLTPSLGAGAFVGVRLREPALSFEIGGRLTGTLVMSDLPVINGSTVPVRSTFTAGTLVGCGRVHDFAFFCAVGGVGMVTFASAPGADRPDHSPAFGIAGARLGIEHALTKQVGLRYFAELEALLGSADILLDMRTAWVKPAGMGTLGVGITFGRW